MRIVIRLVLCLLCLVASAATVYAQQSVTPPGASATEPKGNIDWPSPDGKFAFRTVMAEYLHTIDLIDRPSEKKLQRIGEEDSSQASWYAVWAPDSSRFALMTRLGHPIQGLDVYFRNGDTFRKIDLPDLPETDIPERMRRGHKFPHFAGLNWQAAEEWKKDGSLVMTIVTMIDGAGRTITATRTVVLSFDKAGKAKIVKSAIKYKTENG